MQFSQLEMLSPGENTYSAQAVLSSMEMNAKNAVVLDWYGELHVCVFS